MEEESIPNPNMEYNELKLEHTDSPKHSKPRILFKRLPTISDRSKEQLILFSGPEATEADMLINEQLLNTTQFEQPDFSEQLKNPSLFRLDEFNIQRSEALHNSHFESHSRGILKRPAFNPVDQPGHTLEFIWKKPLPFKRKKQKCLNKGQPTNLKSEKNQMQVGPKLKVEVNQEFNPISECEKKLTSNLQQKSEPDCKLKPESECKPKAAQDCQAKSNLKCKFPKTKQKCKQKSKFKTGEKPELKSAQELVQKPKPLSKLESQQQCKKKLNKKKSTIDQKTVFQALLSSDIETCMKPWVLNRAPTPEPENSFDKFKTVPLKCTDPLILYGITLHRYANNMSEMIRVAELAIESNLIPPADAAPPIPEKVKAQLTHTTNSLHFMPQDLTSFSLGIESEIPEIGSAVVRELLCQSIAAIVSLLGFENTHQSVLDVFVDVVIEFFKKIAYRFKLAFEDEQRGWMNDFPNIAERVLVELGMGGCKGLHDYYQSRVVGYIKILEKHCEDLNKHYKNLIACKTPPAEASQYTDINIKVEAEEEVIEIDTPQVQLALNEELELPSLDAGFQLLSSLEAGT